jgi:hypothetical protein
VHIVAAPIFVGRPSASPWPARHLPASPTRHRLYRQFWRNFVPEKLIFPKPPSRLTGRARAPESEAPTRGPLIIPPQGGKLRLPLQLRRYNYGRSPPSSCSPYRESSACMCGMAVRTFWLRSRSRFARPLARDRATSAGALFWLAGYPGIPPKQNRPAVNRAALSRRHEGRVLINRDCSAIAGAQTTCADCAGSSGDFPTPPPPAKKATTRQDQTRQAGAGDGGGDGVHAAATRDSVIETEPSRDAHRFAK